MSKDAPDVIEGVFFKTRVAITRKKSIRIFNDQNIPFDDFKPTCDKIGCYLIQEGFVTTKMPRIEVKMPS